MLTYLNDVTYKIMTAGWQNLLSYNIKPLTPSLLGVHKPTNSGFWLMLNRGVWFWSKLKYSCNLGVLLTMVYRKFLNYTSYSLWSPTQPWLYSPPYCILWRWPLEKNFLKWDLNGLNLIISCEVHGKPELNSKHLQTSTRTLYCRFLLPHQKRHH